jgi:hypothetical protein
MTRFFKLESDKIMKSLLWDTTDVPRPIQALSVFITVSKILDRYDMVEYFEKAVDALLQRNAKADVPEEYTARLNLQKLQNKPSKEGLIL